jgi:hypothetical protein
VEDVEVEGVDVEEEDVEEEDVEEEDTEEEGTGDTGEEGTDARGLVDTVRIGADGVGIHTIMDITIWITLFLSILTIIDQMLLGSCGVAWHEQMVVHAVLKRLWRLLETRRILQDVHTNMMIMDSKRMSQGRNFVAFVNMQCRWKKDSTTNMSIFLLLVKLFL